MNDKTRLSFAELDYLIFDLSARCKDKDGGTIAQRQALMGLKELQILRDRTQSVVSDRKEFERWLNNDRGEDRRDIAAARTDWGYTNDAYDMAWQAWIASKPLEREKRAATSGSEVTQIEDAGSALSLSPPQQLPTGSK